MASPLAFELVSPERLLVSMDAELVVVPGAEGTFGVMAGHVPMISTLKPGVIDVYETRPTIARKVFVAGGFCEVTGDRCTVLAETAKPVEDLDAAAIDQQIANLTEDLQDAKTDSERTAAEHALAIAKAERAAAGRA